MSHQGQYTDSARADNPEQKNDNWKPIGDLARRLVEEAGGK